MEKLNIGTIQMNCVADKATNLMKVTEQIRKAAQDGAHIVCLQELFSSLYFCDVENHDNFLLADTMDGETVNYLSSLAQSNNVVIIASLFEKRAFGLYHNTTVVIDADGAKLGIYRKMHIPDDPGYYEKFYFTPGDLGYKVFKTKYTDIGVLVCWDQWYPEAARITALMGAKVLFYPTAIGWSIHQDETTNKEQLAAWQTMQKAHAISNGIHVVAVNRVGKEGDMLFWGNTFISNPFGTVLYNASHDQAETAVTTINLEETEYYRTHWPFLRDRRIDSYSPICNRFID